MKWPWARRVAAATTKVVRFVRATFDSAYTTTQNRRLWSHADFLSANAAARPDVRRVIRDRARYVVANNSYARGIVLTLANDVIGTGPRLQMLLGNGENQGGANVNGLIEREFAAWAKAIDLGGKLRTMRMSRAQDGEAFGLFHTNPSLDSPVQLDMKLIECDQVTTPLFSLPTPTFVDGIVLDEAGNPVAYHVLNNHPGDFLHTMPLKYRVIPAASIVHWFRKDRPGQSRGLPDIMPALHLFEMLRTYTLAVLAAAQSAANVAIFMKTTAPPGGEAAEVEPNTVMEFERNMAVFGPEGWEPVQIKAEQPATTYPMFKREILNEIARCVCMPHLVVSGDASGYNYSSGRLDRQGYQKFIRIEQSQCEAVVLDRILAAWLEEAVKVFDIDLPHIDELSRVPHQWFWDGHEHVDPAKEATAQAQRLASNTTTLATEYARQGKDWETELRQRAKEIALMTELGLPIEVAKPKLDPATPTEEPDGQDKLDKEDDGEEPQRQPRAA